LKTYDRNGDGRLSDREREVMRKQHFEQRRRATGGRGRRPFPFPPEVVKKYDKDSDGQLNDDEAQTAQAGIQKMFQDLHATYDVNRNGRLDSEEVEKIRADKAAGKLEDLPQMFLQMFARHGPPSAGGPSLQDLARQMDADRDGRLNEAELKAARAELEKLRAGHSKDGQR
jgi:hypothetical protein